MGNWSLNFNSDENQDTQDIGCKMFCIGVALNLENLVTLAIHTTKAMCEIKKQSSIVY